MSVHASNPSRMAAVSPDAPESSNTFRQCTRQLLGSLLTASRAAGAADANARPADLSITLTGAAQWDDAGRRAQHGRVIGLLPGGAAPVDGTFRFPDSLLQQWGALLIRVREKGTDRFINQRYIIDTNSD